MKKNNIVDVILLVLILLVIFTVGYFVLGKKQSTGGELLKIDTSASTNFSGYEIVVNDDGSGSLQYTIKRLNPKDQSSKIFPKGTFAVAKLQETLNQINDVSIIPAGHCIRSVSFGTGTGVTYNGRTSGDITCLPPNPPKKYQDLTNEISQIQQIAFK